MKYVGEEQAKENEGRDFIICGKKRKKKMEIVKFV
jgi:hypothetical protein